MHGSQYSVKVRVKGRYCPLAQMFLNSSRVGAQGARRGAGEGQYGPFSKGPALWKRLKRAPWGLRTPGVPGRVGSGNEGRGQEVGVSHMKESHFLWALSPMTFLTMVLGLGWGVLLRAPC